MLDAAPLASAFMLGLLGSAHCLGMCGGLVGALGLKQRDAGQSSYLLAYNTGRVISYVIAGLIVGSFGFWLSRQLGAANFLRYFAAIILILLGLYLGQWFNGLAPIEKLGSHIWKRIQPWSRNFLPIKSNAAAIMVGMVWGWLPCGLVYSALIYASAATTPLMAALTMLCFGLGTLPSMLATGLFSETLTRLVTRRWFRSGTGVLMIAYGVWSLPFVHAFAIGH